MNNAKTYEAVHLDAKSRHRGRARRRRQGFLVGALFCAGLAAASILFAAGTNMAASQGLPQQLVQAPGGQARLPRMQAEAELGAEYTTEVIAGMVEASIVSIDLYDHGALSPSGSGSGVVYTADGLVVTNAHVVEGAYAIRVVLSNGRGYTAQLVGADADSDLAVLRIQANGLVPATFADSSGLRAGQRVIAVGNAGGILPGSITQGVISGVDREVNIQTTAGESRRMTLLQTDAAINPGNSGGALVDGWGRVVGINVAKLEDSDIDNIAFAIPTHIAIPVINLLIEDGYVPERAVLGISVLALNETTGPPQGLPAQGLYLAEILPESDLNRLGIVQGDVLLKAGGKTMAESEDLVRLIAGMLPGDHVELEVWQQATGEVAIVSAALLLG